MSKKEKTENLGACHPYRTTFFSSFFNDIDFSLKKQNHNFCTFILDPGVMLNPLI